MTMVRLLSKEFPDMICLRRVLLTCSTFLLLTAHDVNARGYLPPARLFCNQVKVLHDSGAPQNDETSMYDGSREDAGNLVAPTEPHGSDAQEKKGKDDDESGVIVEPIITDETLPDEAGEISFQWSLEYRRRGNEATARLPRFQFFYGLTERFGGEIEIPLAYKQGEGSAYGVGDLSASLKYLLVEHSRRIPAVVVGIELGIPSGNAARELGEGCFELNPFIALLKDFGRFSVQGNVAWLRERDAAERGKVNKVAYNCAFAIPVWKRKVHLLAEVNGDWGPNSERNRIAVAPGVRYNFDSRTSVGVAMPVGLTSRTEQMGIVTQFQFGYRW